MKIVCLLSSLSQPRCIKRVSSFVKAGFEVEVCGYSRGFYDVNVLPGDVKVVNWGTIESGGNYVRRFFRNVKKIKKMLSVNKNVEVLYYAFGFDFSLVLSMLKPKKYVYESSDLIYTYSKNKFLVDVFRRIDKMIIRKSFRTVFTSEGFRDYLYGGTFPKNVIIQPNRVSPFFRGLNREERKYGFRKGLTFAYVGAFRYPNTVFRFARVIGESYPQHSFHFYGDSQYTYFAKELSERYKNVRYFGKFKSPEDLEHIYKSIDMVVACYDTSTTNERIAEPNKLYEAICFCCPIIVSKNTFLEKKVDTLRIGYAIDASNDESIKMLLDGLRDEELEEMSFNEKKLEEDVYIDSPQEIIDAIKLYRE